MPCSLGLRGSLGASVPGASAPSHARGVPDRFLGLKPQINEAVPPSLPPAREKQARLEGAQAVKLGSWVPVRAAFPGRKFSHSLLGGPGSDFKEHELEWSLNSGVGGYGFLSGDSLFTPIRAEGGSPWRSWGVQSPIAHPQPSWAFTGGGFWRAGAGWGEGGEAWSWRPPKARSLGDSDCLPGQGWGSADADCPCPQTREKGRYGKDTEHSSRSRTGHFGRWVISVSRKDYSCPGRQRR